MTSSKFENLKELPGVKQLLHFCKTAESKAAALLVLGLFTAGGLNAQTSGKIKVDPVPAFTVTKTQESMTPGMGMATSLAELRHTFKNKVYFGFDGGILPNMTTQGKGSLNAFGGLRVGKGDKELRVGYGSNATGADTFFLAGKVNFGGRKKKS